MATYKFDDLLKKHNVTADQVTTYGSDESIKNATAKLGSEKQTLGSRIKETAGDFATIGKDIAESSQKRADNIDEIRGSMQSGEQGNVRSMLQTAGQLAGAGADAIGAVFKGAGNILLSDKHEKDVTDVISKFGAKVMANPQVQNIINEYNSLPEEKQRDIDAVGGVVSLITNFIGGEAVVSGAKAGVQGVKTGARVAKEGVETAFGATTQGIKNITDSGIAQTGKELIERVPRAVGRAKENIAEAGIRAEKIRTATPLVQKAIKSNVDERIINTITGADDATKKAYSEVLAIAEESPKTIGTKKQPTIVGGDLASKQYDLINKAKQKVGKTLGEETKLLSKTEKVNMQDAFGQIDDTLSGQGITPNYTKKGVKLDFSGSKYTPAERTKIQELYNLATEGGDTLSPLQIREKDQLFSKLKREANFEGIGNIIIETPEGSKNMFDVFRDVYSNKLDTVSPNIKKLNAEYRKYALLTDDIENSIFKTPNFNATKVTDPAEFAKVNLRRIFGESQSSPVYEAVADAMDKASRGLGYKGATPKAVAEFAQEMRRLFPETTPKTGFSGGIKAGLGDVIEAVSKAGTPNLKDQQKAVRELLDSYLNNKKNMIIPSTKPNTPIKADAIQINKPSNIKAVKSPISPKSTTSTPRVKEKISTDLNKVAKMIDNTDRNIMTEFVDAIATKQKISKGLLAKVQKIADTMVLKSRMGTNKAIAEEFSKILDISRENMKKIIK